MTKFKKQNQYLTESELAVKTRELSAGITKTRLEMAVGKVKNLRSVFNMRKQLAVLKTILQGVQK